MKTRIIAAAVLLPLLLIVLLALPAWGVGILVSLVCAVGAYELLYGTGLVKHPRLIAYAMLMALSVGLCAAFEADRVWSLAAAYVFCCLLFGEMLLSKGKLRFEKVLLCVGGGMLIPYLLCAIVRIRHMDLGVYYVLFPFAMAFLSDSGAYFVGIFFGKHKLAPSISPKKTVEGFFGGIAGGVLGMMIFGLVLYVCFDLRVNFLYAVIYGALGSLASVLGDLTFSVIKRQTGIKDYGNLIPGHGGVLDRFDSISIVGPLTEILLIILPFVENTHG